MTHEVRLIVRHAACCTRFVIVRYARTRFVIVRYAARGSPNSFCYNRISLFILKDGVKTLFLGFVIISVDIGAVQNVEPEGLQGASLELRELPVGALGVRVRRDAVDSRRVTSLHARNAAQTQPDAPPVGAGETEAAG